MKNLFVDAKNHCQCQKNPIILALLVNDKSTSKFLERANLLIDFCSDQCQPLWNNSIPQNLILITQKTG